jgi:hypothetical protein
VTHPTDEATSALIRAEVAELLDARLVSPVRTLLGADLADLLTERIWTRSKQIAEQLLSAERALAAQTVTDLAGVLPEPTPEWWRTPLGQVVGRTYDAEHAITVGEAIAILGISRTRYYQLVTSEKLRPVPGGVSLASVLDRLRWA